MRKDIRGYLLEMAENISSLSETDVLKEPPTHKKQTDPRDLTLHSDADFVRFFGTSSAARVRTLFRPLGVVTSAPLHKTRKR